MNIKKWLALALACLLILSASALAEGGTEVGDAAPDFELTTLTGETFKLSEQQGKVVYVNIWATWCPPCVGEMPDIQRLQEAHPDDLVVIGASVDDAIDTVSGFIEENGYTYAIAMDEGYRLAGQIFPTMYIPETVFITPDGVVSSIDYGAVSYEDMEARYQAALGQ